MNARRETARRWVIDERKADAEVAHLVKIGYDAGPDRTEMEGHVNDAYAEIRAAAEGPRPAKRPRLISDPKGAVSKAIKALAGEHVKLTWPNVATWMQDNVKGCESVSAKTLQAWRDEEGWPASADDPAWR